MAVTVPDSELGKPEKPQRARRAWRPWLLRLVAAAASGFVFYLSFAPRSLWWLAPIAFAGLGLVLRGRRVWGGLGYGFTFGLGLYIPLLTWLQDFLGPEVGVTPWIALSAALALYIGIGTALGTFAARLPGGPVWMAMLVIATETPRAWWPFGGFPWGRVAFSQPEGAFVPLASVGGAPLVGFAVVLTGFCLATVIPRLRRRAWRPLVLPAAGVILPVVAGLALWPTIDTAAQNGSLTVATVQGNAPDIGLELENESATVEANHLAQNQRLAQEIAAGQVPKPDLVVWPETAVTTVGEDPAVDEAVDSIGVPALVGTLDHSGTQPRNTVYVWNPGTGPAESYSKRQLVPFGEYVPARSIASLVTPFVDQTKDIQAGTTPSVMNVAGTRVTAPICYEIAYDYIAREGVDDGAQLIVLPTNNAWYGHSEMSYQQLAMARLRAVEHSRAVVVSATSGVSAIVQPDGTITASTSEFTAASLVGRVPLRQATTLSDRLGAWTEYTLVGVALATAVAGMVQSARTRRARAKDTRATVAE
ncbi:apolipoprotein N-acyltransferase [Amycolatopsis acidicola]|uniref:Apolipoprotein N-acyltransferase n=1 Tax=Amycolatopsis acidicola TaxID=2596893 RepID=A0A5N0VJ00_9PSEU|nr:apolipoprotein N-acyltransferase [Amycolatopsis acidicola]KAA9166357.1 apolipoprotein N-acyltransferase [Amycolatopsis acidicola]